MFEDDYVYQLVAFVRDILEKCRPEDVRSLVDEMLKDDVSILKRIAIHVINKRYDVNKDMFWNQQENLYKVAQHEVYELLKAHCQELDKTEIDNVIMWSEEIEYPTREGKEKEMVEAWKKWKAPFLYKDMNDKAHPDVNGQGYRQYYLCDYED